LRYGMIISLAVLLLGLTIYVIAPSGHEEVDLSLGEMAQGVLVGDPIAIIDLGIVLLIATPLSRVVTATAVFLVDREGRYALLSLLVLTIVLLAILTG
jgi:uncharacterized membrane protein